LLASYWIPEVGIGNPIQEVVVPLTDVLNYTLANQQPQTNVVFLGFAAFTGSPTDFAPPYLSIPKSILEQLTVQPGQSQSAVEQLQSAGIQVLLSVQGYTPSGQPSGMGWDGVPADQNEAFAAWVQTDVIEQYGLDGIDIDNEWSGLTPDPQSFVDTVAALRNSLAGSLITKALWADLSPYDYFTIPVSSSSPYYPGQTLASLLDFGSTMAYGYSTFAQEELVAAYQRAGMAWNQLCTGVQAGPPPPYGQWMTPIGEVSDLAQWVVAPEGDGKTVPPILGMMLYTFSQDIQQWTYGPQNSPGYMFPNPNDHQWQQAIVEGMWGPGNWVVKS
jgi:hypothetical protein